MSQEKFLNIALQQAESRRGFTAPNPAVGAVVVKNNQILAVGRHFATGHPHAEVDALHKIDDKARGAELYVTLEPCCHHGKTPPCTELIIERGIKRVIYAFADHNPVMAGQMESRLRAAGIVVERVDLPEINLFYRSYAHWQSTKRPVVTAKLAISSDHKIAGHKGEPVVITGEECRRFTHEQRLKSDAILTTAPTIINDNPQLNVRLQETYQKPVYILDRYLQVSCSARVFSTAAKVTVLHAKQTDSKASRSKGLECIALPEADYGLAWEAVLDQIGQDGVHDLWLEAGGRCFQSAHINNVVQKSYLYIAKKALGDQALNAFAGDFDVISMASHVKCQLLGQDKVYELDFCQSFL